MRIAVIYLRPLSISLVLCLCMLASKSVLGQQEKSFTLTVVDSLEKIPLEKCTVSLLSASGVKQKLTSNSKGVFSFKLVDDSTRLVFEHIGYNRKELIIFTTKHYPAADTILLSPADNIMEGILVKAAVPPVVVRGDTTEFHIDSAMFEPYDVVEDLVKRLPGLEIDADGKMTFQGKPINRILVDGEDLFGGDPSFSMKKLPAGMISKIQVMDTKTLEQVFNNTPTDGDDKTLNIKLKPGNKIFSSAELMTGTKNQLEGNAMISLFEGHRQVSVMGNTNSSNKIGLAKISRGPSSSFTNAGLNFGNRWGSVRLNSSYSFNDNGNRNEMYRERTQLISTDTSFFTKSNSLSLSSGNGHQLNLGANWLIDSTSTLDINLSYSDTKSSYESRSSSSTLENGTMQNETFGNYSSKGGNRTLVTTLFWAKRFNKKGRNLSISGKTNYSGQQSDLYHQTTNTYFKASQPVTGDTLDRYTKTRNRTNGYSVNIIYAEPLSKTLRFNINSQLDFNQTSTDRDIYNLDSVTHSALFDSLYSAAILSSFNTQSLAASLLYTTQKWNVTTGLSTVRQQAVRSLANDTMRQNFLRYAPSVNASYVFSRQKILRISFSGNTVQPTIDQLQPVPDNSNPMFIRLGNPGLKTAFTQNYTIGYNYNTATQTVTASLAYAPVNNQIVQAVYYDSYRKQTSRYLNVDGIYSARGSFSVSKTKRQDKKYATLSIRTNGDYGRQVFFQHNQPYFSRNYSVRTEISFTKKEQVVRAPGFSVSLSTSVNRNYTPENFSVLNTTRLNFSPKLEGNSSFFDVLHVNAAYQFYYNEFDYHSSLRRNDEYTIHQMHSSLEFQLHKKYSVQGNAVYQYNTRVPANTPKGTLNCNLSATAQVFKDGRGRLSFTAQDLFAINNDLRRVVGENYIEDVQIDNLRNYFTLRFQYNFNKISSKK